MEQFHALSPSMRAPLPHPNNAFSLIELLVVVAIIAVMTILALPALSSIFQARGASEAAYQVSSAIERARAEAVARNTFAWLALQPVSAQQEQNLRVAIMASRDGTTNFAATNLIPLLRPVMLRGAALHAADDLIADQPPPGARDWLASPPGIVFQEGGYRFENHPTLTFTPDGEATVQAAPSVTTGFAPLVAIGLVSTRGETILTNNPAVVLVDGSTGISEVVRP